MSTAEETIIKVLKERAKKGDKSPFSLNDLLGKCVEQGVKDRKSVESALIKLIDNDVVDYEMDDDLNTTEIWLL